MPTSLLRQREIGPLPLALGGELPVASLAYASYGQLNARGDNAVLITHGLTSGADMLEGAGGSEGSWADLLLPGRALDARRYFVVCSNVLGSAFGSTGPASPRPGRGQAWGADFPALTLSDMVLAQKRLLQALGVRKLLAVAGPSFGGMQALQWALDYPDWVRCIASVVSGLRWPPDMGSAALRQRFAQDAEWQGGRYTVGRDMRASLRTLRLETLKTYGMETILQDRAARQGEAAADMAPLLDRAATQWAERFDPHALLALKAAGERFDARARLHDIRCPLLFAPASSDRVFPPDPAEQALLQAALGDRLRWCEIETPYGHAASGIACAQWEPDLARMLQAVEAAG